MNKRILISFSGGKTSAYMTWCLLKKYEAIWFPEHKMFLGIERIDGMTITVEILVVFANTSKEEPETLDFVRDCDLNFGFNTIWIEAIMNEYGVGATYRIVNYETACRNGDVYESMIAKHGIPNIENLHCTRELKTVPITKLVRDYGWENLQYDTAIGYRIDEPKRWAKKKQRAASKAKRHIFYFVDEKPIIKLQVNGWWALQTFNLQLEDHQGNCDLCYKKSENKTMAIVGCCPSKAVWWEQMEQKYGNYTPPSREKNAKPPYTFYRGNTTIETIRRNADKWFADARDNETAMEVYKNSLLNNIDPNQLHLCNESCEPF
jgi:3'-phosphoadenosine 5'-phosphosulfate sulfotransferase (PAPS reductase)/FAD synthetase